jgi:pyruvate dehydrogenase E1 component beta subunit
MSLGKAFNLAMREEMAADDKVICIGEDIGARGGCWMNFGGLYGLYGPERVLEMPMVESAYTYFSVGTALMGYRPIVEFMFADFATLGFEGIVDMAAKIRYNSGGKVSCPVTFVMPQGGGGKSGCHHSQSVEAWFMNVPGIKIVAPTTPADVRAFYRASIRDDDPVVFIYQRALLGVPGEVPDTLDNVPPLRNAGKIVKEGSDLTVVAYHRSLLYAQAAAAEVEAETGTSVEVIDPIVLCPFDKELIFNSVKKTGRLLVAHEAPERGGFSAQIVSWVAEECLGALKAPPVRVCGKNGIIPFGDAEDFLYPSKEDIKAGMLRAVAAS